VAACIHAAERVPEAAMVAIPAGPFTMGADTGSEDERPQHVVALGAFLGGEFVDFHALGRGKLGNRRQRRSADDEERVELPVRHAIGALLRVELRSLDVRLRDPVDLEQFEDDDLGARTGLEDADALAAQC
jgi:hypothetical protein